MWPSPVSPAMTPNEQFIRIPYSRVPSPLSASQKEQIAQEQEAQKETMKATAMAGTAVGVAATAGGIAVIAQIVNNIRVPNIQGQGQGQGQQQNQNQNEKQDEKRPRRRRLRRPRLDSESEEEDKKDDDDDDDDDAVTPELSPPRENVTITPADESRPSVIGLLKKGLTRDTQQQDSSMSILSHYFPAIPSIIDENHYFKYIHIEQDYSRNRAIQHDIHTRFIDSNMYISIISKSPIEMSDILGKPLRPSANILAIFNHVNNTLYGDCSREDELRMRIRPIGSTYTNVLDYTST